MWTYNTALSSDKDLVRFALGDTDTDDQLLSDEEIASLLVSEGGVSAAASRGAEHLAAKYARQADRTVGNFSISASQRAAAYTALAKRLAVKGAIYAIPSAGGTYTTDDETLTADSNRKRVVLRPGLHNMPGGETVPT